MNTKLIKKHFRLLATSIAFAVYLFTLAQTVIHLDSGELAAVQATLGISHPTGYPLFTIVGFLFTLLLFPFSKIYALNLLAAIFCAIAVYFITSIARLILDYLECKNDDDKFRLTEYQKIIISSSIGLMTAFSATFWFQSTSVEVYSLHVMILSLIIYFTLRAYFSDREKYWLIVAVFLALGFSNHMTTILIIPGLAYLFFLKYRINKKSLVLCLKMIAVFLPILTIIYFYLPLRASAQPSLNWGNPIDWERFVRHVSGEQYQVWIFSSFEAAKEQLVYFINLLPQELGYIGVFTSIVGFVYLFKKTKAITIFFLISFLTTVIYSINYDISDIDSYFLLAVISLIMFSIGFFVRLINVLGDKFIYSLLVIPVIFIMVNLTKVNQNDVWTFEDYTKSMLDEADKNSVIFGYLWDYFISPSYYFQYVEGYRTDVAVIDKELLRRSWYYDQLENNMPNVIANIKPEINQFLVSLEPFEKGNNFNPNLIEERFQTLMTKLVSTNVGERSFYITPELFENEMRRGQFSLPDGYTLVPLNLYFKVVPNNSGYIEADPTKAEIRFNKVDERYQKQVRSLVFNMMIYRILYELQYNEIEKAERIYKSAKSNFPEIRFPQMVLDRLQIER